MRDMKNRKGGGIMMLHQKVKDISFNKVYTINKNILYIH